MKYIVTWVIVEWVITACPPQIPIYDEFGRTSQTNMVNAVVCGANHETPMQKEFLNRDSAFAFYNRARAKSSEEIFARSLLDKIRIDSIP